MYLTFPMLAAALALQSGPHEPPPLAGVWVEIGPRTTFRFEPCGTKTCGLLQNSIYIKADADARDVKNPDPRLRGRRLKGLAVLQSLKPTGDGWKGTVYIPSMGEVFPMALTPQGARTLRFTLWLKPSEPHTVTLVRTE